MAVDTVYRFNGTDGADVTSGFISGSQALNGGTMKYAAAAADEGATGIQMISVAGVVDTAKWAVDTPSVVGADGVGQWSLFCVAFWTPTTLPSADETILQIRNTANSIMRLLYSTAGNLYMLGGSGTTAQTLLAAAPVNTKYYLTGGLRVDTATTGKMTFQLRTGANYATTVGSTITQSAWNLGATAFNEVALGSLTASLTTSRNLKYDTLRVQSGASTSGTFPGYLAAYSPPSATAPTVAPIAAKQVTAGSSTTFTASATDPSGTIDHYTWRVVSSTGSTPTLTNGSTATVTVASIATPADVQLGVTATSTTGLTSPEVFTYLYVNAASGVDSSPTGVRSNPGGWVPGGTATDLTDGFSDSGEWVASPAGPAGAILIIDGPPVPSTAAYVKLDVDLIKAINDGTLADVGQTGTVQLQYFSGSTAISSIAEYTVSRTNTAVTLSLNTAQNAALDAAGRWDPLLWVSATAA